MRGWWWMAAALLLWMACGPAQAQAWDVDRLMQQLADIPDGQVSYTERKYSALLSNPVVSSGVLAFHRPDSVEKEMRTPKKERYAIAGDEVVVTRNGGERRFALSSQLALAALAASLRGVLLGDQALLRRYFKVELQGDERAWRLMLEPLDASVARYVTRVSVTGSAGRLQSIDTEEASGDHSLLQVQ